MSELYQPDQVAFPNKLNAIKLLSQRDLALRVPINYVPVPGVSVSAACSVNDTYRPSIFAKCLSNLLVSGFRRFTLDLYWDETQDVWSFCPVQLGPAPVSTTTILSSGNSTTALVTTALTSLTGAAIRSGSTGTLTAALTSATILRRALEERQDATTVQSLTSARISPTSSTITSTLAPVTDAGPLIRAGPYTCATGTDFSLFMNVLVAHLKATENDLNATTIFLTFNINHAAAVRNGTPTAEAPAIQPSGTLRLGVLYDRNSTAYQYRPFEVPEERRNLNDSNSWFGVRDRFAPDSGYFTLVEQNGLKTSPDGWPSEGFVEFVEFKRLLAGFGTVSQDMSAYNTSLDNSIFPPGIIENLRPASSTCYFDATTTKVSAVNNTWALADVQGSAAASDAANLVQCGIAPSLNKTIGTATAAEAITPYQEFVMSTIWSWDISEPRDNANSSQDFHCAALNASSGRWQVESCNAKHYCACRIGDAPYGWQASTDTLPYDRVDQACASGSSFTVPRTALENRYLLDRWRRQRSASSISDELLFVNFNDLDIATCWVIGQNSTCPYQDSDNGTNRIVVVPTVAAIIVGVLTILTVFVKCAANRQNTRRRRKRGNDNMGDYEGVPA